MKVYLVTAGEYSDYRVLEVFARKEDAESYELGDDVEEYDLHEGPVEVRPWHIVTWWSHLPDRPRNGYEQANPHEETDRRNFDGHPDLVRHDWRDGHHWRTLIVQGWDLDRVRKVYSEQRAQFIARQDMGVEGCTDE